MARPVLTPATPAMLLAALLGALTSCAPDEEPTPAPPPWATLRSLTEVRYDAAQATLNIMGSLTLTDAVDFTVVRFYTNASCAGAPAGRGLYRDFPTPGIEVRVASSSATPIYINTNTESGCQFLITYDPLHAPPAPPTFTAFSPSSPSRLTAAPLAFGTTSGSASLVRLYDDEACAHQVGAGAATDFSQIGIPLTLTPERKSQIRARAVEPFGNVSDCVALAEYEHTTSAPAMPSRISTLPKSPSRSLDPFITGAVSTDTVSVSLFQDAACTQLVASGDKATFETTGIALLVAENSATDFYGTALDAAGNSSPCAYLIHFENDTVPPAYPTYESVSPPTPTRLTIYPQIKGVASPDTVTVNLFVGDTCVVVAGSGTRGQFESSGINVGVQLNDTTRVMAQNVDAAGNVSQCRMMVDYINDTVPPEPPAFNISDPVSPNNRSVTPLVLGAVSFKTVTVNLYSDDQCVSLVGSGTADAFMNPGIRVTLPSNAATLLHGIAVDYVGNRSECTFLSNYQHSTAPAPAPAFVRTIPASPSNVSFTPFIQGTAPVGVVNVQLFTDLDCTNQIATGSRANFVNTGLQVTLTPNFTQGIYANTTDIFGNNSDCTYFTHYTHDNIQPTSPLFGGIDPVSPSNVSVAPTVSGTVSPDTQVVSFYDSALCSNRIATGSKFAFETTGIVVAVPSNTTTELFMRAFDAAGNSSGCLAATPYTHDNVAPPRPRFLSATPRSPSYSRATTLKGVASFDTTVVGLFSDPACGLPITSGAGTLFSTLGIPLLTLRNATSTLYAISYDGVGNASACTKMLDFVHSDLGPSGVFAAVNPNGSIALGWVPDPNAQSYIIKRALRAGGPYTLIAPAHLGNSFVDLGVKNNTEYHYVVAAANATGVSDDSAEGFATVTVSPPSAPSPISSDPGQAKITVNWTGSPQAISYTVYRSVKRGGPYLKLESGITAFTHEDESVTNDVPYYYVVTGSNPAGESGYSNETGNVAKDIPQAPSSFMATALANGDTLLTWTAPAYFTRFNIKDSGISGVGITVASTTATSYLRAAGALGNDPGLHYFSVSAMWGLNESQKSNEFLLDTTPGPALAARAGNGQVALDWAAMSNGLTYDVLRASKAGGPYTVVSSASSGASFVDTSVSSGTTYWYAVRATYQAGPVISTTLPSLWQDATPGPDPSAPSQLVMNISANKPSLSWSAPTHYNSFNVYRASSAAGPWSPLAVVASTSASNYTDAGPALGMNYYRISVLWGQFETPLSNTVAFRNGVPLGFTAVPANGQVSLSWNALSGTSSYTLRRSTQSGGTPSIIAGAAIGTAYLDTSVTNDTGYFYSIAANFPDASQGQFSAEIAAMPRVSGAVPSGVTVTSTSSTGVGLTWAPVQGSIRYKTYWALAPGGPWTNFGQVNPPIGNNLPAAIVAGLASGSNYYLSVTSVNGASVESARSAAVVAFTAQSPAAAPGARPGNNQIQLAWNVIFGATSYTVQRSSDSVTFVTVASGVGTGSYTDSTAVNGTQYFYRYLPIFSVAPFPFSSVSAGTTPGITPLAPAKPVVLSNTTGTDLTLSWGQVSGATEYNVKFATVSGGPYALALASGSSTTPVSSLTEGTTYYFVISALNGTMESPDSPELSAVPLASPAAPTAVLSNNTAVQLTWAATAGATSYDLLRSVDQANYDTLATGLATGSHLDSTVTTGETYTYRYIPLFGAIAAAESLPSVQIGTGVVPLAPAAPSVFALNTTSVVLDWLASPNAATYAVKRATVSGGPYVNALSTATLTAAESGLVPGTTYYYVVTALSATGAESPLSSEVAIQLVAPPASLSATFAGAAINLSWSSVSGATTYSVFRGTTSGGPYGELTTGVAGLSYSDSELTQGVQYYYVVAAKFASGASSPYSPEATATGATLLNLQISVELTDLALASIDSQAVTFARTTTSIDTAAYDGVVTYELEVVASNDDGAAHAVSLLNASGTAVGAVVVSAASPLPTRLRASVTPDPGRSNYRLRIPATTNDGDLKIHSARLLITQTGATRTRIYVPLLASSAAPNYTDAGAPVEVVSVSETYGELAAASIYQRDTSALSKLAPYNAWELETLVAASAGSVGAVALINTTRGASVEDTESYFSGTGISMSNAPFEEGVTNFDALNEGEHYQVSVRCVSECATAGILLFKAGLWVTLEELSKAEVYLRNSLGYRQSSPTTLDGSRALLDLSLYSLPEVFFQAVAAAPPFTGLPGATDLELLTAGTNDSGTAGLVPIALSPFNFSGTSKGLQRSGALSVTSGDRLVTGVTPTNGAATVIDTTVVVRTRR